MQTFAERPTVGRIVHYVSFGTPGGEYSSQCRAAVVAEAGAWVTIDTINKESFSSSEGRPIRMVEEWYFDDACALAVLNPGGQFFKGCRHDEADHKPGTWHWPERV